MDRYRNQNDESQREYITGNLKESMFVEAGAGAGKTSLIVARILEQLKSGIKPERIVAITFTNAAAEELRGRIVNRVKEERKRFPSLTEVLHNIEKMQISTIHSFCNLLLGEKVFEVGLPVGFKLLEPKEAEKRKDYIFSEWFKTLEPEELDRLYSLSKNDKKVACRETLLDNFKALIGVGDYYKIFGEKKEDLEYKKILEEKCFLEIKEMLPTFFEGKTRWITRAKELLGTEDIIKRKKGNENERWNLFLEIEEKFLKYSKKEEGITIEEIKEIVDALSKKVAPTGTEPYFKDGKKELGDLCESMKVLHKEIGEEFSNVIWNLKGKSGKDERKGRLKEYEELLEKNRDGMFLLELALKGRKYYREKSFFHELDNDRLLEKTEELLSKNKDVRSYFFEKYDCIYVDEFQDTDPLQESIIWNITTKGEAENLKEGKLFVVGDPKQAIYRFRGADPDIYFKVRDRFSTSKDAGVFRLALNYRSNERLVSYINKEFEEKALLVKNEEQNGKSVQTVVPIEEMEVPKRALIERKLSDKELSGQYFLDFNLFSTEENEKGVGDELVFSLPRAIQYLVEEGYKIRDGKNSGEGSYRKVRYGDFMLLFSKHRGMGAYAKEFEKIGIKTQVLGEILLSDVSAIKNFIAFYKFLSNPFFKRYSMGVTEILKNKWKLEEEGVSEEDALQRALLSMEKLAMEGRNLSPYGKAIYLLEKLDLMFNVKEAEATTVISTQTKLQQMIENLFLEEQVNEAGFIEKVELYGKTLLERELLMQESEEGVVRLINYHKAKGLEANIVILFEEEEEEDRLSSYRREDRYYPYVSLLGNKGCFIGKEEVANEAIAQGNAEKKRLYYVAKTRAKEALLITNIRRFQVLGEEVESTNKGGENPVIDIMIPLSDFEEKAEKERYLREEKREENSEEALYKKFNPSGFELSSETGRKLRNEAVLSGDIESLIKNPNRPKGNVFGTVLHRGMELLVNRIIMQERKSYLLEKEALAQITRKQVVSEFQEEITRGLSPEEAEKMLSNYRDFLEETFMAGLRYFEESGLLKKMKEEVQVLTEFPFSYYEGEESEELLEIEKSVCKENSDELSHKRVWVNGTADLVLLGKEEVIIMDYKSDLADYIEDKGEFEQTLFEKYRGQLALYRYSIHKLYGIKKEKIRLKILYFKDYGEGLKMYEKELL